MTSFVVRCLEEGCPFPAFADEPIEHDNSTAGPVLSWQVRCTAGHIYTDHTSPFGVESP